MTGAQIEAARVPSPPPQAQGQALDPASFTHKPITRNPPETRMGHGKGPVEYYVAQIKPGVVLFELAGHR